MDTGTPEDEATTIARRAALAAIVDEMDAIHGKPDEAEVQRIIDSLNRNDPRPSKHPDA